MGQKTKFKDRRRLLLSTTDCLFDRILLMRSLQSLSSLSYVPFFLSPSLSVSPFLPPSSPLCPLPSSHNSLWLPFYSCCSWVFRPGNYTVNPISIFSLSSSQLSVIGPVFKTFFYPTKSFIPFNWFKKTQMKDHFRVILTLGWLYSSL